MPVIYHYIRNIIPLLYSQLVLNVRSRSKAMFASFRQIRGNGEHRPQEGWLLSLMFYPYWTACLL